jgi:hypothetical protein
MVPALPRNEPLFTPHSNNDNDMNTTTPTITWPTITPASLGDAKPPLSAPASLEQASSPMDAEDIPSTLPNEQGVDASKRYQLVVLGRGEGKGRQDVLIRLPQALLNKLGELANGSRSMLVELALHHMVNELEQARDRGEPMMMVEARDLQDKLEEDLKGNVAMADGACDEEQLVFPELPDLGAPPAAPADPVAFVGESTPPRRFNRHQESGPGVIRAPHLRRRAPNQRTAWNEGRTDRDGSPSSDGAFPL